MNAAVTQTRAGSDASVGTLKTALNGAGETTIVIESEAGVVFSASSDLDIAGTIVPHSDLDTATNQRQHQVRGGAFGPEPTAPTITLLYGVDTSNSKTCVAAGTCFKAKNCAFCDSCKVICTTRRLRWWLNFSPSRIHNITDLPNQETLYRSVVFRNDQVTFLRLST